MTETTWDHNRLPMRGELLAVAIACVNDAVELGRESSRVPNESARSFVAIAGPLEPAQQYTTVAIGQCHHGQTTMQILPGGSWLHIHTMVPCAMPPDVVQTVRT